MASIGLRSRDPRLVWSSVRSLALTPTAQFLKAGGVVRAGQAWLGHSRFAVDSLTDLGPAATLIRSGATIESIDGTRFVTLADGLRFALPAQAFACGLRTLAERVSDDPYSRLDVRGALVLDIGANIGDSSLCFWRNGASRVIAYEPFLQSWATAMANISLNGASDRITLLHAGVAAAHRTLTVAFDPDRSLTATTVPEIASILQMSGNRHEETVRLIPFAEVVEEAARCHPGLPIVGKIDCEGAEFEMLLDSTFPPAFERVRELIVETHYRPPDPLVERLQGEGFDTQISDVWDSIKHVHAARRDPSPAAR